MILGLRLSVGFVAEEQWHPWKHCPNNYHDAEDKRGKLFSFFQSFLTTEQCKWLKKYGLERQNWVWIDPEIKQNGNWVSTEWTAEPTICDSICDYENSPTNSLRSPPRFAIVGQRWGSFGLSSVAQWIINLALLFYPTNTKQWHCPFDGVFMQHFMLRVNYLGVMCVSQMP